MANTASNVAEAAKTSSSTPHANLAFGAVAPKRLMAPQVQEVVRLLRTAKSVAPSTLAVSSDADVELRPHATMLMHQSRAWLRLFWLFQMGLQSKQLEV